MNYCFYVVWLDVHLPTDSIKELFPSFKHMDVENGANEVENLEYVLLNTIKDKSMVFIRSTSLWSVIDWRIVWIYLFWFVLSGIVWILTSWFPYRSNSWRGVPCEGIIVVQSFPFFPFSLSKELFNSIPSMDKSCRCKSKFYSLFLFIRLFLIPLLSFPLVTLAFRLQYRSSGCRSK